MHLVLTKNAILLLEFFPIIILHILLKTVPAGRVKLSSIVTVLQVVGIFSCSASFSPSASIASGRSIDGIGISFASDLGFEN